MKKSFEQKRNRPPQYQSRQPGRTVGMIPRPDDKMTNYKAAGKLIGKTALITGGDSGIGRATAIAFAKEGANIAVVYLEETDDAGETKSLIEHIGRRVTLIRGDIGREAFCKKAVKQCVEELGGLDILVNNSAEQHPQKTIEHITEAQLEKTFRTNVFSFFFMTKAALPFLKDGSAIINTSSVTAYHGNPELLDYSATKGAVVAFTRSLSQNLVSAGIRVNAVAPGPVWTPLIPASFDPEKVAKFGKNTPMKRAGEPDEIAPCFVFLASDDSSYMTGQVLHPNGGHIING